MCGKYSTKKLAASADGRANSQAVGLWYAAKLYPVLSRDRKFVFKGCIMKSGIKSIGGMLAALWMGLSCQVTLANMPPPDASEVNSAIAEIAAKQAVDVQELRTLLQEFEAMRKTNANRVLQFVRRSLQRNAQTASSGCKG